MKRKRIKRFKPSPSLKKAISKLPLQHRNAIEEWLDPTRFRKAGGK